MDRNKTVIDRSEVDAAAESQEGVESREVSVGDTLPVPAQDASLTTAVPADQKVLTKEEEELLYGGEPAQRVLDRIKLMLPELESRVRGITPELAQENPTAFGELLESVSQDLGKLGMEIVQLETSAKTQFRTIGFFQRVGIWVGDLLRALHGSTQSLSLIYSGEAQKREAYLGSAGDLRKMLSGSKEQLDKVRNFVKDTKLAPLRLRQNEILSKVEEYNRLKQPYNELLVDLGTLDKIASLSEEWRYQTVLGLLYNKYVSANGLPECLEWYYETPTSRQQKSRKVWDVKATIGQLSSVLRSRSEAQKKVLAEFEERAWAQARAELGMDYQDF